MFINYMVGDSSSLMFSSWTRNLLSMGSLGWPDSVIHQDSKILEKYNGLLLKHSSGWNIKLISQIYIGDQMWWPYS